MNTTIPKLAKPGAGLPFFEGLAVRYVFYPSAMRKFDWMTALDNLHRETEKIAALIGGLPGETFKKPVLIKRLTGLEDSSRFWSAAMAVEHLLITLPRMAGLAARLAAGETVSFRPDTAAVKPKGEDPSVPGVMISSLRAAAAGAREQLLPFASLASDKHCAAHPFFGPIPAKGWVWALGTHQRLHRVQIEKILEGIKSQPCH